MIFHAPQIIYLCLMLLGLGSHMADHGKPRRGKYNFWVSLVSSSLVVWILYWGGFFK